MRIEPPVKRVFAFIDGQNLFKSAKESFGYTKPNFAIPQLPLKICSLKKDWTLQKVYFYTGIPDVADNPKWHNFWANRLRHMQWGGVVTYSRALKYRNKSFWSHDGKQYTFLVGEEKGIDIRIALDVVRLALRKEYDVALIFSQDQDLSEVAAEIKLISQEQERWIKAVSAFPVSPTTPNRRGINATDWIKFDKATYDQCLDSKDYF